MKAIYNTKGRYVIGDKKRFFAFLCTVIILTFFLINTLTANAERELEYKLVNVKNGDTIWSIAKTHTDNMDIRKLVYEIQKVNNINNGIILAGQQLKIPKFE